MSNKKEKRELPKTSNLQPPPPPSSSPQQVKPAEGK